MFLLNTSASPENLKYNLFKQLILKLFSNPHDDFRFLMDRLILMVGVGGLLHHFCEKIILKEPPRTLVSPLPSTCHLG